LTRANMAAASRAHASTVRVRRRRIKHFIQKSAPFSNRPFFHLYVKERERMPCEILTQSLYESEKGSEIPTKAVI
jgi:hypothetical protein